MRPNTSPEAVRSPSEVEHAQHVFEDAALETRVVLRQLAGKRRESGFDRLHGGVERRAEIAPLGCFQDHVETRTFGKVQRSAAGEIGFDERAVRHLACGLVGVDRRLRGIESVGRMAEEDQAHDGHEIFVRRQIGVRPQIVGDLPKLNSNFSRL